MRTASPFTPARFICASFTPTETSELPDKPLNLG
jgi:hypothetical protein